MFPSIIFYFLILLRLGLFVFCSIFGTIIKCFILGLIIFLVRFLFEDMIGWVCYLDLIGMNKIGMFQYEMDQIMKVIQ